MRSTDNSDDQAVLRRRRVVLDLDLGSEPIAGSLRVGAQPAQPFAGYTQLISTLDAARTTPAEQIAEREAQT